MLCYQPSRTAAEIVSDTFSWLTANRGALAKALLCMLVFVAGTIFLFDFSLAKQFEVEQSFYDEFLLFLQPFALFTADIDARSWSQAGYAVLTFGGVVCFVPVLITYFRRLKAVRNITFDGYTHIFFENIGRSSIIALILAAAVWISLEVSPWLCILVFPLVSYFWPWILMDQKMLALDAAAFLKYIRAQLLLMFIACVIQAFPLFCLGLFILAAQGFDSVVPGLIGRLEAADVISIFGLITMQLMYCLSIVVYVTGSLITHGSLLYDN